MAWTQADVDALKAAIKGGVKRVQFADQEMEFHSVSQQLELLAAMEREVNTPRTFRYASVSKGT